MKKMVLILMGIVLISGVFASGSHNAGEICVSYENPLVKKTLQQSFDDSDFNNLPFSVLSCLNSLGHSANEVWVSVNGNEMWLSDAMSLDNGLCGSQDTMSYSQQIVFGHYANEIFFAEGETLQQLIDSGRFCHVTHCNSCNDCTTKIADANEGDIIRMSQDFDISSGFEDIPDERSWTACIFINGKDRITFDCDNHQIVGDNKAHRRVGINVINQSDSNNITNCIFANITEGLTFEYNWQDKILGERAGDNNFIYNISIDNAGTGIIIDSGNNNILKEIYGGPLLPYTYVLGTHIIAVTYESDWASGGKLIDIVCNTTGLDTYNLNSGAYDLISQTGCE